MEAFGMATSVIAMMRDQRLKTKSDIEEWAKLQPGRPKVAVKEDVFCKVTILYHRQHRRLFRSRGCRGRNFLALRPAGVTFLLKEGSHAAIRASR